MIQKRNERILNMKLLNHNRPEYSNTENNFSDSLNSNINNPEKWYINKGKKKYAGVLPFIICVYFLYRFVVNFLENHFILDIPFFLVLLYLAYINFRKIYCYRLSNVYNRVFMGISEEYCSIQNIADLLQKSIKTVHKDLIDLLEMEYLCNIRLIKNDTYVVLYKRERFGNDFQLLYNPHFYAPKTRRSSLTLQTAITIFMISYFSIIFIDSAIVKRSDDSVFAIFVIVLILLMLHLWIIPYFKAIRVIPLYNDVLETYTGEKTISADTIANLSGVDVKQVEQDFYIFTTNKNKWPRLFWNVDRNWGDDSLYTVEFSNDMKKITCANCKKTTVIRNGLPEICSCGKILFDMNHDKENTSPDLIISDQTDSSYEKDYSFQSDADDKEVRYDNKRKPFTDHITVGRWYINHNKEQNIGTVSFVIYIVVIVSITFSTSSFLTVKMDLESIILAVSFALVYDIPLLYLAGRSFRKLQCYKIAETYNQLFMNAVDNCCSIEEIAAALHKKTKTVKKDLIDLTEMDYLENVILIEKDTCVALITKKEYLYSRNNHYDPLYYDKNRLRTKKTTSLFTSIVFLCFGLFSLLMFGFFNGAVASSAEDPNAIIFGIGMFLILGLFSFMCYMGYRRYCRVRLYNALLEGYARTDIISIKSLAELSGYSPKKIKSDFKSNLTSNEKYDSTPIMIFIDFADKDRTALRLELHYDPVLVTCPGCGKKSYCSFTLPKRCNCGKALFSFYNNVHI